MQNSRKILYQQFRLELNTLGVFRQLADTGFSLQSFAKDRQKDLRFNP